MNRNAIIQHVELWKSKLGSYENVANKCDISGTALSQVLSGKYGADETKMLQKIASKLGYKATDWNIVREIANYKDIYRAYSDAKEENMWFCVSNKAGSGKTGTLEDIYNQDMTGSVVFIQAEEWTGRQFLMQLIRKTVGENSLKGKYKTVTELVQIVSNFFNEKQFDKPVLLIDEADKLRPAALRTLIPIYNKTEDRLGLIMSGTENLEKEIKSGVRCSKKGYDEVESRIGRNYIHLKGATEKEVYLICEANEVTDDVDKRTSFGVNSKNKEANPGKNPKGEKEILIEYAEDFRRLKRLIKREKLLKKQ